MRLRTFTAPDMPTALGLVRAALGDDAVILSTREKLNGHRSIVVTAAADAEESAELRVPSAEKEKEPQLSTQHSTLATDDLRHELQNILRFHNLPELFVAKLMKEATEPVLASAAALCRVSGQGTAGHLRRMAMEKLAAAFFTCDPIDFDARNAKLMLVGTPGAGKTLTVAKMAARMAMDGQPLSVITTDNKRAGGVEQLEAFTRILKIDLKVAASRDELVKYLKTAAPRVLIDTAGCNPYDGDDCAELKSYAALEGVEPVLALPAGGDCAEAIDTAEAFAVLPIRRLLVTRTDTARRFGAVLAVAAVHNLAFCNASHAPGIIDPLHAIDAGFLAKLLLRYQLKSSI